VQRGLSVLVLYRARGGICIGEQLYDGQVGARAHRDVQGRAVQAIDVAQGFGNECQQEPDNVCWWVVSDTCVQTRRRRSRGENVDREIGEPMTSNQGVPDTENW
jgi:hypothetical protein